MKYPFYLAVKQLLLEFRFWIKLIFQISVGKLILILRNPTCKIQSFDISSDVMFGKKIVVQKGCTIRSKLSIGDFTYINESTLIDRFTESIGKYCSISYNVKIGLGPHPSNYITTSPYLYSKSRGLMNEDIYDEIDDKGLTIIGNDVLIGANSIVLAGVNVGDGAIIAAGSVVTKDVSDYTIVGGVPAKVIKQRFTNEIIDQLKKHKFWDIEPELFQRNRSLVMDVNKYLEWAESKKY